MIKIAPLARADVDKVAHLQLPPAQRGFVGPIAEMTADPDPLIDFYIIQHDTEIIGFFKIDRDFFRKDTRLPAQAIGLRGLLIGGQYQRLGLGGTVLETLPNHLRDSYPGATQAYLTVELGNPAAMRAYLAHGWVQMELPLLDGKADLDVMLALPLR